MTTSKTRLSFGLIALIGMSLFASRIARAVGGLPDDAGAVLKELHAKYEKIDDGEVASYIPELTKQDPKPIVYGLALEDNGRDAMPEKLGLEPTGLPFNSILAVDIHGSKLQNPLDNAGADATFSLRGDANGNSTRGILAIEDLAAKWSLHLFHRE